MKIEKMLNVHNANTHDWRGVASAMDLSTDDVNQLEQESGDKGKMGGLFDKMIHTKKTINDLIALLRHDDVQRLDVIDDIIKDCNLHDEQGMKSESSEDLKPGLFACLFFLLRLVSSFALIHVLWNKM